MSPNSIEIRVFTEFHGKFIWPVGDGFFVYNDLTHITLNGIGTTTSTASNACIATSIGDSLYYASGPRSCKIFPVTVERRGSLKIDWAFQRQNGRSGSGGWEQGNIVCRGAIMRMIGRSSTPGPDSAGVWRSWIYARQRGHLRKRLPADVRINK